MKRIIKGLVIGVATAGGVIATYVIVVSALFLLSGKDKMNLV